MNKNILLDKSQINQIISDFKQFDEIIIWLDDYNEKTVTKSEITGLIYLYKKLNENNTEIMNFYGGYLSILLGYIGLSKFSCGICISENKKVFSEVGGGGLPIRYYEPNFKRKFTTMLMRRLYFSNPELFICECPICIDIKEEIISTKDNLKIENVLIKFLGEVGTGGKIIKEGIINWQNSRYHFLLTRKNEQFAQESNPLDILILDLREKNSLLKNRIDPFIFGQYEYLETWSDCLYEES